MEEEEEEEEEQQQTGRIRLPYRAALLGCLSNAGLAHFAPASRVDDAAKARTNEQKDTRIESA